MKKEIILLAIAGMGDVSQYIAELILLLPEEQQEEAICILAGIPNEVVSPISTIAKDAILISYNRLTNTVEYKYSRRRRKDIKHSYKNAKEAQAAMDNNLFVEGEGNTTDYLYVNEWFTDTNTCRLSQWLKGID